MKPSPDIAAVLAAALRHFEAGRGGEARRLAQQVVKAEPGHGGAHYLLALIALRRSQPRPAAEHLARALAATPDAVPVHMAMARAQAGLGRDAAALSHLRQVLAQAPAYAAAHLDLGHALRRLGRRDEAVAAYRTALAHDPALAEAQHSLGAALGEAGEARAALVHLRRAIELRPGWALPHANAGVALRALGRLEQAAAAFAEAARLEPGNAAAHRNLAEALKEIGRLDDARRHAERAASLAPRDPAAAITRALVEEAAGRLDPVPFYQRALALAPGLAHAHYRLGEIRRGRGDLAGALDDYRRCLALDPDDRHGARLALALLGVEPTPPRAPEAYVRALFDQYAGRFDRELTGALAYRGPELMRDALVAVKGTGGGLAILDAGCGTGLCAPLLRPLARRLEGVDLSPRMVEKARERGLYDVLAVGDLVAAMAAAPGRYDAIVAADVFTYIGALGPAFAAAFTALAPGGVLVFSVERGEGAGFMLAEHHRYAHGEAYLRECAAAAGFTVALWREDWVRQEKRRPVPGFAAALTRS